MSASAEIFGERLRAVAAAKGFTLRDMAKAAGVSAPACHKWTSGICFPSSSHLVALCKALDCSVDWLLSPEPIDFRAPSDSHCRSALEYIGSDDILKEAEDDRGTVAIMRHVARKSLGAGSLALIAQADEVAK